MAAAGVKTILRTSIARRAANSSIYSTSSLLRQPRHIYESYRSYSSHKDDGRVPDFAFAFDIDGVLLRSSDPIPGAAQSLKYLQQNSIPFILLTNGGGKSESERIEDVSAKLSVSLSSAMIVQSHTPFQELANASSDQTTNSSSLQPSFKDKCVLVCGGTYDKCQKVARQYGFNNVITPGDIYLSHPEIWPFSNVFQQGYYHTFAKPIFPKPINADNPNTSLKIDAIFVYNDPRDWGLDIQLILDLLLSHNGILGTYSKLNGDTSLPNNGYLQDGQPPIYFSNPDLLWAAKYHLNRLGQGGFRAALEGVWNEVTDNAEMSNRTIIGKPHRETYEFAERRLMQHRNDIFRHRKVDEVMELRRVYMIGDNPESDIAGANNYRSDKGVEWISLLTRTGVFHDRTSEGVRPAHEPRAIVDDVFEAVKWGLRDSRWDDSQLSMQKNVKKT